MVDPAIVNPPISSDTTDLQIPADEPVVLGVDGEPSKVVIPPPPEPVSVNPTIAPPEEPATTVIPTTPLPSAASATSEDAPSTVIGVLMQQGQISTEQYQQLLMDQAQTGKTLENLIGEKQLVSESVLTQAKATLYALPYVKLAETGVSPEAISVIPESVARRYVLLPFIINKQERTLSVAMKNPLDLSAIDFVEKKTGFKILPYFASPNELDRTIAERYAQSLSSEVNAAIKETKSSLPDDRSLQNLAALSKEVIREAPINKIVETILGYAMKARASDVHIEPQEDRTRVRYRIDGILQEKLILPRTVHEAVLSRIKILSGLKIDEKRLPQDGRFTFVADGEEVDLRISTLPVTFGEKVVMRLLKKNAAVPSLGDLGLRGQALLDVEEAIKIPHGIILVTGPTGSGKTTTLYSVLHQINTPKVNIMTLEDPVEYQIAGVNQVQINPQIGLTFASGLRSFLRQDPNIIMVGEIRDKETAELAVQASLTGHLVFSTLHTNSAAGALPRLIDMEAEPFLLASTLNMSMAQRVARQLNPAYMEEFEPEPAIVEDIKKVLGPLYLSWCKQKNKDPEKMTLFRTTSNRPETEPEYKGRIAIFEVMKVTEEISHLIIEKATALEIEKVAQRNGMLLMKQDGYLKALEGITTIEEVLRIAEV